MIHTVQQDILMPTALDGFLTKLTDVSTTNHTFFTVTIHKEKNVLMLLMFIIWSPTIFGLSLSLSTYTHTKFSNTNSSLMFTVNWTRWFVHILTYTFIRRRLEFHLQLSAQVKDFLFYEIFDRLFSNAYSLIFAIVLHKSNWAKIVSKNIFK